MKEFVFHDSLISCFWDKFASKVRFTDGNIMEYQLAKDSFLFIPTNMERNVIPISHISSVVKNNKVNVWSLFIGYLCMGIAFGIAKYPLTVLFFFLGICLMVDAFTVHVVVNTSSGRRCEMEFMIFEKKSAEGITNYLQQFLNNRMDDTNVRKQTDRVVDILNGRDRQGAY